jgi:hypothetical protein
VCLVDKGTPVIRYDSSVKEQPIFLVSDKFEQCINISELEEIIGGLEVYYMLISPKLK